jgi:hypothetical protein
LAILLFAVSSQATVRRCNNNSGINNSTNSATFYTTLPAAYAAAASGDTIIIEPSPTTYGSLTLTKKLTIIGNGGGTWLPSSAQINNNNSTVGSISFDAGSQNSYISGINVFGNISLNTANISVIRCFIDNSEISGNNNANNITIEGCLIYFGLNFNGNANTGLIIRNNICKYGSVTFNSSDNGLVENNSFNVVSNSSCDLGSANIVFRNNIVKGISNFGSASLSNNICVACSTLPLGSGNQNSVTVASIFGATAPTSTDPDIRFQPIAGSTALDNGFYGNGDDIGAFNNGTGRPSYIQGYLPSFPSIYQLSTGAITGNTMSVTVSTKANN